LTDERYRENRVAVAERDGERVGIAMSGPPLDAGAAWARQLYVLYVYAADHGTGAGLALLEAVVDPEESAALWVADPNPSRTGVLPQPRLRCRRDGPGRGRGAGDPHGPRHAAQSVIQAPRRAPELASAPGWTSAAGRAVGDVVAPVACGKLGRGCGFAGTDADEVGQDGCGDLAGEGEQGGAA
jgi:hypothetical protein